MKMTKEVREYQAGKAALKQLEQIDVPYPQMLILAFRSLDAFAFCVNEEKYQKLIFASAGSRTQFIQHVVACNSDAIKAYFIKAKIFELFPKEQQQQLRDVLDTMHENQVHTNLFSR